MAIERVEILLTTSVPQDPLQNKLVLAEIERRDAQTRKELDDFLKTGWREIGSGMVTVQDKGTVLEQRLVIILFKDETKMSLRDVKNLKDIELFNAKAEQVMFNNPSTGELYLQPVWDEGN